MLEALQQQLSDIYQVGHGYDVRDYLITDPLLARVLGEGAMLTNTEETLLVSEDEQGLALSLFLDGDLLGRAHEAHLRLTGDRVGHAAAKGDQTQ